MNETVIKAENIGKKYVISHQNKEAYTTLRDTIAQGAKNVIKKASREKQEAVPSKEDFWALKGASFEIKQGDRVGIIGRNGAGKSTLLKILSRITEPTTGKIVINGRIASLLEVGTGFHPELTGRENIFLNGAILGMSKEEITRKFDEIIEFAGVEKFLDTPVKRYSSGMYVRLAFAIAAHLEPEILIVDEVLAVGDAQFQKKCLGKMREVGSEGRTVLFVSHNMAAIQELCDTCIWLDKGQVVKSGPTNLIIEEYVQSSDTALDGYVDLRAPLKHKQLQENSAFKFTGLRILNSKKEIKPSLLMLEPFSLEFEGELQKGYEDFIISYSLMSSLGYVMVSGKKNSTELSLPKSGLIKIRLDFPNNYFGPGGYSLSLGASGSGTLDWIQDAGSLHVDHIVEEGRGIGPDDFAGVMIYPCTWSVHSTNK